MSAEIEPSRDIEATIIALADASLDDAACAPRTGLSDKLGDDRTDALVDLNGPVLEKLTKLQATSLLGVPAKLRVYMRVENPSGRYRYHRLLLGAFHDLERLTKVPTAD